MKNDRKKKNELIKELESVRRKVKKMEMLLTKYKHTKQNIVERKRAEEELRESEQRYRILVETLPDGVIVHSQGRIVFANRASATLIGAASPAELVGKPVIQFVHPEYRELALKRIQHSLSEDVPAPVAEEKFVRLDGTLIDLQVSASPFSYDSKPAMLTVCSDITERKRAEEASKQIEENFRRSLEDSPLGVRIVTAQGDTVYANQAILDIYGYDNLEELKKTPVKDRYTPESYAAFKIRNEKRRQGKFGPSEYEISIVRKNGEVRDLQVFRKEIFWNGAIQFQVLYQDFTERKQVEGQMRQMQKLEGLGTLAGGIAHDFNNILGIILAYTSSIERFKGDTEKLDIATNTITKAVERGKTLVQQILTFARKTEIEFGAVNVNDVVMETMTMILETFPKILTYSQNFDKAIPFINADRSQIYQALLNLCVNARDAMPNGGLLTINTRMVSAASLRAQHPDAAVSSYVCLEVDDTGEGMTEETRKRIFEPFFTTKGIGKGTGLGLAVVFGIVQSHKGFIDVESEIGNGTTFRIYLPVSEVAKSIIEKGEKTLEEIQGGTETLLIVEDEEILLMSLRMVLVDKGYTVLSAQDGFKALVIYRERKKDIALVLTDLGLPSISGLEVCQHIKAINPNEHIILATGFLDPEMKSEFLKAGIQHFLYKPYDLKQVLKLVREVLDEK